MVAHQASHQCYVAEGTEPNLACVSLQSTAVLLFIRTASMVTRNTRHSSSVAKASVDDTYAIGRAGR